MEETVSLKYVENNAILKIDWKGRIGSLLYELAKKSIQNVQKISVISVNSELTRGSAFSIYCEDIYAIIQSCNAKYLEISYCYLSITSVHNLIKILKTHHISEIKFNEVKIENQSLEDIIKNFDYLKVDMIHLKPRKNNLALCETIKKLCEYKRQIFELKLTLLLIQKHRTYKNFPPRVILYEIFKYI